MREPDETTRVTTRQCANCGSEAGDVRFCSNCGHPAFVDVPTTDLGPFPRHEAAADDAAASVRNGALPPVRGTEPAERLTGSTAPGGAPLFPPPPPPAVQPVYPAPARNSGRIALIVAGVVVALAALGVALALTVLSSSDDSAGTTYKKRVATAFAPVLNANRTLSSELGRLHGSRPTAAKQAVAEAQRATTTAQGTIGGLTTPAGSKPLQSEGRQALDRESTYLTAVATTLNHPSSPGTSQLQSLAGNVTSALDAVDAPLTGAGATVNGADTLTTWAHHAAHLTGGSSASTTGSSAGSGTTNPYAGQRDCGDGVHAGPNTSCDFALNVRQAYDEAPGASATVDVYSQVTGQTYTMSCSPAGSGVTCSGGNGASASW